MVYFKKKMEHLLELFYFKRIEITWACVPPLPMYSTFWFNSNLHLGFVISFLLSILACLTFLHFFLFSILTFLFPFGFYFFLDSMAIWYSISSSFYTSWWRLPLYNVYHKLWESHSNVNNASLLLACFYLRHMMLRWQLFPRGYIFSFSLSFSVEYTDLPLPEMHWSYGPHFKAYFKFMLYSLHLDVTKNAHLCGL